MTSAAPSAAPSARSRFAEERLALTERGDVRLQLKTAYRDTTTHVILEPLDFLDRHVKNIRENYGLPVIVALNRFASDTEREFELVRGAEAARAGGVIGSLMPVSSTK